MSKLRTLLKALWISIKIKGPVSVIISLLGFAAAFLPVLLAGYLRALTDALQMLAGEGGVPGKALKLFSGIVMLYIVQVVITNVQQYTVGLDEIKMERYLKRTIMRHKCEVRYQYVENYDDFHNRLAFIEEYAGKQMARSITYMITVLQLLLAFCAAAFTLWSVSPFIVLILFITSIPPPCCLISNRRKPFAIGRNGWKKDPLPFIISILSEGAGIPMMAYRRSGILPCLII